MKPTSACSGSRPKPAPSRNSSMVKPRTSGPPIIDGVTVAKGYERPLAQRWATISTHRSTRPAPMRWTYARRHRGAIPRCRGRRGALPCMSRPPSNWPRRLAQIGRRRQKGARALKLVSQLKTGQRLVVAGRRRLALGRICRLRRMPPTGGSTGVWLSGARLVDIENEAEAGPASMHPPSGRR